MKIQDRCANCKHWKRDGETKGVSDSLNGYRYQETPHRLCGFVTRGNDGNSSYDIDREHFDAVALVVDAEAYCAELWTLPKFGCVGFEAAATIDTDITGATTLGDTAIDDRGR